MLIPYNQIVPTYSNRSLPFEFHFRETGNPQSLHIYVELNNSGTSDYFVPPEVPILFDVVYNNESSSTIPNHTNTFESTTMKSLI